MNTEQLKSAIRWIIATVGPFLIAHGYATDGTLQLVGGALISLAPLIWSMFVHTDTNAVAVVDTLAKSAGSPVKAVVTEPTKAGQELAAAMPGNTTVVAGTTAAAAVVKS